MLRIAESKGRRQSVGQEFADPSSQLIVRIHSYTCQAERYANILKRETMTYKGRILCLCWLSKVLSGVSIVLNHMHALLMLMTKQE